MTEITLDQAFQQAVSLHQNGNPGEALGIYQQILNVAPEHIDCLKLAGISHMQLGDTESAITLLKKTVTLKPDYNDAHYNLGVVYQARTEWAHAEAAFRRVIELAPTNAAALQNLGSVLVPQGRMEEATDCFRKAVEIKPDFPEAFNSLGQMQRRNGALEEAVAFFKKALSLNPGFSEAHYNLGLTLKRLGRKEEAVDSFKRVTELDPDNAEATYDYGASLQALNRNEDALPVLRRAVEIRPDYTPVYNNLGNVLQILGDTDAGIEAYNKAIELDPKNADAYSNLGAALQSNGQLDIAVAAFRKATAITPDHANAFNNLGTVLLAAGDQTGSINAFHRALDIQPDYVDAHRNLLAALLYLPDLSEDEIFDEHLTFAKKHAHHLSSPPVFSNSIDPERRLKIGYFTSDFRDHPVGTNLKPVIENFDRNAFEVTCYAEVLREDRETERFKALADNWRNTVRKSDEEVADMIRADQIDILVFLAGRFDSNRPIVSTLRPAPIQVSFHDGATSGCKEMDYWLTDVVLHPDDTKEKFTEELYRLPVFYQYTPMTNAPPVYPLPAEKTGRVTFCSFNNPRKINDQVISLWSEVLKVVPESRLLLKYRNLFTEETLREKWIKRFEKFGVSRDRLDFMSSIDKQDQTDTHLAYYEKVDIALDTFPFNGATTTFEGLSMGVPVITLMGESFISRAAGSLVTHIGHPEFAANSQESYVEIASTLAADLPRLAELRRNLRNEVAASRLCDHESYTGSLEAAYHEIWRRWCQSQKANTS